MNIMTMTGVAASCLLLGGCFGLAAAKKCSDRHHDAEELVSQMKASAGPSENIGGRWICVSAAYPDQREFWRIAQQGNALRVVATTSRGESFTLEGAVSRDEVLWVGKNSGAGAFHVEGDALVGKHDVVGSMSCDQVDITCTRN